MVDISVVFSTFNRAELMERSLMGYFRQEFPIDRMEIIVLDDWSTDRTDQVLRFHAQYLPLTVIRPPIKAPGEWRSEASVINIGLRAARGELIVATHPEIIPGIRTLSEMWKARRARAFITSKTYFLSKKQQEMLDTVFWYESNRDVEDMPGFFDEDPDIVGALKAYAHRTIPDITRWDTWQFAAMERETWQWFGGFGEYKSWGSTDMDFATRRELLDIKNVTLMGRETYVIHQNHDALDGHQRNMQQALGELRTYTKENARLNNL